MLGAQSPSLTWHLAGAGTLEYHLGQYLGETEVDQCLILTCRAEWDLCFAPGGSELPYIIDVRARTGPLATHTFERLEQRAGVCKDTLGSVPEKAAAFGCLRTLATCPLPHPGPPHPGPEAEVCL